MLAVLPGDLMAAVQVLCEAAPARRRALARRLVAETCAARAHVVRTGQAHPVWGAGTLAEAAFAHRAERAVGQLDAEALACLMLMVRALHPVVAKKTTRVALSA